MNIWSNVPIGDHGTRKIGQQREKIVVASFTIINLLVAPLGAVYFYFILFFLGRGSRRVLQDVTGARLSVDRSVICGYKLANELLLK